MTTFNALPEFEKEKKRLSKKLRSLHQDVEAFDKVIAVAPTGIGKNFSIIHYATEVQIVKARLACRSLKNRSLRIIYAHHAETITFIYLEIYFKGDKPNEDRKRIKEYLHDL